MASSTSIFKDVTMGSSDPMFNLRFEIIKDTSPQKIGLGAGVYRDEQGNYYELPVVSKAKKLLEAQNLGHDYERTTGDPQFLKRARELLFSDLAEGRIASVQTVSGTGANSLGVAFLRKFYTQSSGRVYIGMPAWGNYKPLCTHAGFTVETYQHYDFENKTLNFGNIVEAVKGAPKNSIFVLQGCCHNPTGMDLNPEQWVEWATVMKEAGQFPLIDIAYQGFGSSLKEDTYGVRHFVEQGFEVAVAQSFSKNMGLYGERVGALHVVVNDTKTMENVHDQLRSLIRCTFSSSPAYGSRLATLVMGPQLRGEWLENLNSMRARLEYNRAELYKLLTETYQTPGKWEHLINEKGLFSFLTLSPQQVRRLAKEFHIYLPETGRINVAGLSPSLLDTVARALNLVVREKGISDNGSSVL